MIDDSIKNAFFIKPSSADDIVIKNLIEPIEESQIQAMTTAIARALVSHAMVEHGVKPANDNA